MNWIYTHFLGSLKSAVSSNRLFFKVLLTKHSLTLTKLLYRHNLIMHYKIVGYEKKTYICIILKYYEGVGIIHDVKMVSSSGHKFYWKLRKLELHQKKYMDTIYLLSTSKGVLTGQEALNLHIGGLVIGRLN